MLKKAFSHRSITFRIVSSILLNTVLLLLAMAFLINYSYNKQLPLESKKIALNEIEKIASTIAYPLWYLDSAHVLQILKKGVEKSELLTFIEVKTRIENREKPLLKIKYGKHSSSYMLENIPINFSSYDSLIVVGELSASFSQNSPTIKKVIREQFRISISLVIISTSFLILMQIIFIKFFISNPLKAVKNSLIKFKQTGIREKVNWKSNDEFGEFVSVHNESIDYSNDLEEQLSNAKTKAEKASLAKSVFLSHMSHELRTPLTAILGFTQILREDPTLNSEQSDSIKTINTCGDHLLDVINNILTFSKIESGEIEINETIFNLRDVISSTISALQVKAQEKDLYLRLTISNNIPQTIQSDENKFRQILFNLVGNAIKFTEKGGVTVKIKSSFEDIKNSILTVEISDTGPGVDDDEKLTIFTPFKQSKTGKISVNSTGLGLPICKDFIELMGGEITVNNNPNEKGTTFTFTLKIREADDLNQNNTQIKYYEKLKNENLKNLKALIIEDTLTNIFLLKKLLGKFELNIEISENGLEGVNKYSEFKPDIVFVDKNMPIMDGIEAISKIRELEKKLNIKSSIISLTADIFTEDINSMMKAGANLYMRKPFTLQELYEALFASLIYLKQG